MAGWEGGRGQAPSPQILAEKNAPTNILMVEAGGQRMHLSLLRWNFFSHKSVILLSQGQLSLAEPIRKNLFQSWSTGYWYIILQLNKKMGIYMNITWFFCTFNVFWNHHGTIQIKFNQQIISCHVLTYVIGKWYFVTKIVLTYCEKKLF